MSKKNPTTFLNEPVVQPGERITFERDGSMKCVRKFRVAWEIWMDFAPVRRRTRHPEYPQLVAEEVEAERLPGDIAEVTTTYYGNTAATKDTSGSGSSSSSTTVVINPPTQEDDGVEVVWDVQTVDIDIQNHPKFTQWVAESRPGWDPFTADKEFRGFKGELLGVRSYLAAQQVKKTAWTSTGKMSLPVPMVVDDGTGIRIAFTSSLRGGIYRNEETVLYANNINAKLYS